MAERLTVTLAGLSERGRKDINQDFLGSRTPSGNLLLLKGVAMVMSDGVSSSQVSQMASQLAVNTFLEDYYCTADTWTVKHSAEKVIRAINTWLYSQTRRGPHRYDIEKGYVCTFSAVVIKNRTAHIFHLGDTRVYRINTTGIEQLTHDHRLTSEGRSSLSRALGMSEDCQIEYVSVPVQQDDIFLMATDGIYECIDHENVRLQVLAQKDSLAAVAQQVYQQAFDNNSQDNLSIQLLRVNALPDPSAQQIKKRMDDLPVPPTLSVGMTFDGYTILRDIHANNRSKIYLAEDSETKAQVVIKVLSTEAIQNEDDVSRFLMEEWFARRINSAYVLKAYLPERQRNYLYTVFEYIDGQTLSQWALDNPKPDIETVRVLIEQIAKGLLAFHRKEMLHQDLRPDNIMIDRKGMVKIIDFGAVSVAGIEESISSTPDTYLRGTALYSAPEYFLGEPGTVQSDLFSLGVICYFLLSGEYPYGPSVARCKTQFEQNRLIYTSLWSEKRAIPKWVDFSIAKAVHTQPLKRYQEISEFLHDLRVPNKQYLNNNRSPLIEKNPVGFWKTVSFILFVIVLLLSYKIAS